MAPPTTPVTTSAPPTDRVALAALFAGAACIAFAPIFVRLSELGPSATAFYRFAFAVPLLWLWLAVPPRGAAAAGGRRWPQRRSDVALFVLAGMFFAGDMGFWHWSITYTSVANATLLANTAPVFVVIGGWLIFRRRVTRLFLVGMMLALAGAAVLMQASFGFGPRRLTGDLLGVVTGAFYGAYFLVVERLRTEYATAAIMSFAVPVAAAAILVAAVASGESLVATGPRGWAVLVGLAVVSQVIGQSLIAFGLAQLPASFASVGLLVQPVLAALFAWVLLSEAVGPVQGLGAAVVLIGVWLARRGGARHSGAELP